MKTMRILILVVALSLLLVDLGRSAATDTVDWWVIAGGGGPGGGSGEVVLDATLGQPFIGPSGGEGVLVGDGYWYGVSDLSRHVYLPAVLRATP
jgi:hypothetical protein